MNEKCFVHPEIDAAGIALIPCAPGGKIHLCGDCMKPENGKKVFEAYVASHGKNVKAFKQTNPGS